MRKPLLKVLRPFVNPMVDREPLEKWRDGRVTLIVDAAHATYPVGSSGASQAIVDTRVLGAGVRTQGVAIQALDSYEANNQPTVNVVTRANRARQGPNAIMQMAEDICDGDCPRLDQTLPYAKRKEHVKNFKTLAGLKSEPSMPVTHYRFYVSQEVKKHVGPQKNPELIGFYRAKTQRH